MKLILFSPSDVQDIHDVLEVTVYDEDKDHKYEFLGKVYPFFDGSHIQPFRILDHGSTALDQERWEEVDPVEGQELAEESEGRRTANPSWDESLLESVSWEQLLKVHHFLLQDSCIHKNFQSSPAEVWGQVWHKV